MNVIRLITLLLSASFASICYSSEPYVPKKRSYKFEERFCFLNISPEIVYKHLKKPQPVQRTKPDFSREIADFKRVSELDVLSEQLKIARSLKAKK